MKTFWNKHKDQVRAFGLTVRANSLRVVGLGLVSFGIGMIFPPAGVIAAGLALLLIEWSVEEDGEE